MVSGVGKSMDELTIFEQIDTTGGSDLIQSFLTAQTTVVQDSEASKTRPDFYKKHFKMEVLTCKEKFLKWEIVMDRLIQ